jgi:hypothetical protein
MFDTDYFIQKIKTLNIINDKNENLEFEYNSDFKNGINFHVSISDREIYIKTNTFFNSHEISNGADFCDDDKEIIDYYIEMCEKIINGKARIKEIKRGSKPIKAHLEYLDNKDWTHIETIGKIDLNIFAKIDEKIFHNMVS